MREQDRQPDLAALTREQRAALFERLHARPGREPEKGAAIPRRPAGTDPIPLSFAQQRMWFLEQFEGRGALFNVPEAFRLRGPLDEEALQRALDALVARHEVLRTTFPAPGGEPRQVIAPPGPVPLEVEDLRVLPAAEREVVARRMSQEEARRPFDLVARPGLRATLLRLAAEDHVLLLAFHHICYDGWSAGVLRAELGALYEQEARRVPAALPELPIQCADHAVWQRGYLQGETRERLLGYWRKQLDRVPVLQLPLDRPRPPVQTHEGAAEVLRLPPDLTARLEALGQQEGCTLFMTLLAAFQTLLCHYSGQVDLPVGTQIANRTRVETEGLIGCLVNTLVMRADLSGNPTFRELLRRVRKVSLDGYTHQDLPFELLVNELHPERDLSRPPLFQVMFVLQAAPASTRGSNLSFDAWEVQTSNAKVDLTLEVTPSPEGLVAELIYNRALFDAPTIARMLAHLRALLEAAVAGPDRRILRLPLLTSEERELLRAWNDTRAPLPNACIHQMFERQVDRTPEAIALEWQSERLSYAELDARANQLAHHLRQLGVRPGARVGLCLHRTQEMVVAVLGIMKAGAAYVPLDPEYPADRLAFTLRDSRVSLLVTQESLLGKLAGSEAPRLCVDRDGAAIAGARRDRPEVATAPGDVAYVLYTSGSTGKPKGVNVEHGAVASFLAAMRRQPGISEADRLLSVTTIAFDIAGLELYLPLSVGACIVLASREAVTAGEQLLQLLQSCGATMMQATPSAWRMLLDAGWKGSPGFTVLCGGEALPRELADQLLARSGAVWNLYGPTEATIWATAAKVEAKGTVSLGRPIANMQAHVLNAALEPVPLGVAGEVYLGGTGVAQGYLDRPELTADRFVPDPFLGEPGARLYRTGDLGRWMPGGTLEFLGRVDHQVKVRGHRIELGEIEAALAEHPAVAAAVVTVREDQPGTQRLVGYLLPRAAAPIAQELRAFLKERLPEYMVPAAFMTLEKFPLTPNGKIDRRALPAPGVAAAAYVAPRTPEEETLARIWAEVLRLEKVSIHANFFELGGDSLLVIRVVARANKVGLSITTRQVFQHPTVADLAQVAGRGTILAEQGEVTGPAHFTSAQLWWLEMRMPRPPYYSIAFALEPRSGLLDATAAERALHELVRHHDALRLRLVDEGGSPRLMHDAYSPPKLGRIDLSGLSGEAQDRALKDAVKEFQLDFDLARGPLFKAAAIDFGPSRPGQLLFAGHYLTADLESWQIVLGDADAAYGQLVRGEPLQLARKGTSYRQWAERLDSYARSPEVKTEVDYWLAERRNHMKPMPLDHPEGINTLGGCDVVPELLSVEETTALQQVLKGSEILIDGSLVAALVEACAPWVGERALQVQLIGHGRPPLFDDVDLSRTVGWLNVLFPALVDLADHARPLEAARAANEQLRAIPKWGLGYGLLRYLRPYPEVADRLQRMPRADFFFNYTGQRQIEYGQFKLAGAYGGYVHDLEGIRPNVIAITGAIVQGQLELRWEYNEKLHHRSTIERLARATSEALRAQIAAGRR